MKALLHWVRKQDFSYVYALLGESTLGLMFILYVVIARVVGPAQYGIFSAAVALGGILGVFIQFGLPVLLTRCVAAQPTEGPRATMRFLLIQVVNSIPIFIFLPLLTAALGFSREGLILCYLMVAAELCRSMKMSWRSVMKGHSWFKIESISVFLERSFTVILSATILFATHSLILTTGTLVLARILDNLGTGIFLKQRLRLSHSQQCETWGHTYRRALPFALHGLMWVVYYQVDMIMLKALAPEAEVGFYGAAYRVMEIFGALPRVVFYVAFTQFAKCHAEDPATMPHHIFKSMRMLFLLIIPCLVIAGYLQPHVIPFMFGEAFVLSVSLLAVLLPGLAIKMFSTLSEEYLLATEREKQLPYLLLIVSITNIATNMILIPRMGAMGAAIATVVSEAVFCFLGIIMLLKSPIRRMAVGISILVLPTIAIATAPSLYLAGIPILSTLGILAFSISAVWFMMSTLSRQTQSR